MTWTNINSSVSPKNASVKNNILTRIRKMVLDTFSPRQRHPIPKLDDEAQARFDASIQLLPAELRLEILELVLQPWTPSPLLDLQPAPTRKLRAVRAPRHFGPGQVVHMGLPEEYDNMSLLDSALAAQLLRMTVDSRLLAIEKNNTELRCCIAQHLWKKSSTWKGDGPCEECQKRGSMCVLFIDWDNLYYKGKVPRTLA